MVAQLRTKKHTAEKRRTIDPRETRREVSDTGSERNQLSPVRRKKKKRGTGSGRVRESGRQGSKPKGAVESALRQERTSKNANGYDRKSLKGGH